MTDDEIAGMLIGLLLAGQHTSSTTSSWLGFFIAKHKDIQVNIVHSLYDCKEISKKFELHENISVYQMDIQLFPCKFELLQNLKEFLMPCLEI